MTSDNIIKSLTTSEREIFEHTLQSFTILDIGTIESVDEKTGRATVRGNQIVNNRRVIYKDAEVIYPGNTGGVFRSECSSSACLIFIPATCIPDIQSGIIRRGAPAYSTEGVKVFPIGNGSTSLVQALFDSIGNFVITGDSRITRFTEDFIESRKEGVSSVSHNMDGGFSLNFVNTAEGATKGSLSRNIDTEGVTQVYTNKDGSVMWSDILDWSGTRQFIQTDNNNKTLCSISIASDGTLSLSLDGDTTISSNGTLTLKGNNVNINSTGEGSSVQVNGTNLKVDK